MADNSSPYPNLVNSMVEIKKFVEPPIDRKMAKQAFRQAFKKIEQVRNISSPILKVITVKRHVDELMAAIMGVATQKGQVPEADFLITVIFYLVCTLKSSEAKYLGARFIEECTYVDEFMHEERVGVVE